MVDGLGLDVDDGVWRISAHEDEDELDVRFVVCGLLKSIIMSAAQMPQVLLGLVAWASDWAAARARSRFAHRLDVARPRAVPGAAPKRE